MTDHRPFRFGVVAAQARSGEEWAATARRAEALGYATFLIPDTLSRSLAPMPALSVAAAVTRTLHVGTYVLANDYRNPLHVARESAALDLLSGGRFELGIGAGRPTAEDDHRALGIPFDPAGVRIERLAEALGIVKALLAGERVSAPGPHYAMVDAQAHTRPVQRPRPPILIAGGGRRMLALAAREADIVALAVRPDADEAEAKERVGWLRQAAGDRFRELELNVNLAGVLREDSAGPRPHSEGAAHFGLDLAALARSGSLSVLSGTVDQMCDQLLRRRDSLGVSYVTGPANMMEELAPVVERLSGR